MLAIRKRTIRGMLSLLTMAAAFVTPGLFMHRTAAQSRSKLEVLHVKGNVYLIAGAGPNITMQVGDQYVVLVDSGPANRVEEVRAAIRSVSSKPIGMIINTSADPERTGGNEELAAKGFYALTSANQQRSQAAVISHLNVLNRMIAAKAPTGSLPVDTYDTETWKFSANDEAVILEHPSAAHSDGDTIVFFRRSDVLCTGALFDMTKYPVIDEKNGGSIEGILNVLNHLSLDVAVPKENEEGGTYIIPGQGHIADRNDLANYRDMLTIIRDRIQDLVRKGKTLEEVKAARPTYDYDGGYGVETGPWTTSTFIEAVYRELSRKAN